MLYNLCDLNAITTYFVLDILVCTQNKENALKKKMSGKLIVNCLTKKYPIDIKHVLIRNYSAKAAAVADQSSSNKPAKKSSRNEKPVESTSFVLNLFRGQMKLDEVFPYPIGMCC